MAAAEVAAKEGLDSDGYRVVVNVGQHGCQSVDHVSNSLKFKLAEHIDNPP